MDVQVMGFSESGDAFLIKEGAEEEVQKRMDAA